MQPQGKTPQLRWGQKSVAMLSREHRIPGQQSGSCLTCALASLVTYLEQFLSLLGFQAALIMSSSKFKTLWGYGVCDEYMEKLAVAPDMRPRGGGGYGMKTLTKTCSYRITRSALCTAWAWLERSMLTRGFLTELLRSRGGWCWGPWTVGTIEIESALWAKAMAPNLTGWSFPAGCCQEGWATPWNLGHALAPMHGQK